MANIFKSYDSLLQRKKAELKKVPEGSEQAEDIQYAIDILKEIQEYRDSYKWLYKKQSKNRLEVFIQSGYDYKALCEKFNIKRTTATTVVNWAGRQFKKKVGEHTLELLQEGYTEEALAAFYIGSGKMKTDKLLVSEFSKHLPEAELAFYKLPECMDELKALQIMSKAYIANLVKDMDAKKMGYLRYILEGHSKKAEMLRPALIALLQGTFSIEEVLEEEKRVDEEMVNIL